ncbi:MAG: hypothetical protein XU11_C0010G0027 [Candidatus Dadabacteria bacterium CSP1-2]|jgi:hypothetical protein|nr:MAG: hypothetical protein XU11_C0010G0027 [Candidatus Dadabacteria bacterium CSP1-2]
MGCKLKSFMNIYLLFLVILDVVLSITCFFFPEAWFNTMHGAPYVDPQGLLRRTGAVWAAFVLIQFIALLRWQKEPYWLAVVAGVRFTEIFSDWVYLGVASNMTWLGTIGLFVSPPANLIFGIFLIIAYLKFHKQPQ